MRKILLSAFVVVAALSLGPGPAFAQFAGSQYYGALAAAEWNDSSGTAHVAIGVSYNASDPAAAVGNAVSECRAAGGFGCRVVAGPFTGCGYITDGVRGSVVAWGTGASAQEAYDQCSSQGVDCRTPIGGCNDN